MLVYCRSGTPFPWTHIDSENLYAKKVEQVSPWKDPLENDGSWPQLNR